MSLKVKTFHQILNDMANWITSSCKRLTNFYVGSVQRTLLEAVATEIESLYFQMVKGFKYAIENAVFHSFNFAKNPAVNAVGEVTLIFKTALISEMYLPKGHRFSTVPVNGVVIYFEVMDDMRFAKGSTSAVVPVKCTEPGTVGNVPAYSIQLSMIPLIYVSKIYNENPFITGLPEETEEERKKRFNNYIQTLSRGTKDALLYGCLKVEGVSGAYPDENIGFVRIYVHDALGNLSEDLKSKVIQSLEGYRCAGVEVVILPVVKKPVDINIGIKLQDGFDYSKYTEMVQNNVSSFLNYFTVSHPLIKTELIKYTMAIDENAIKDIDINLVDNVQVDKFELIRAGNITVYPM